MKYVEGGTLMKVDGLLTKVVSQPTVRVKNTGNGADALIYSTNSIDASQLKSNPFTGNTDGSWGFYIPDTRYNVELSAGSPPLAATIVSSDQIAFDPYAHFNFSNFNSGYLLQQNSAGVFVPVSVNSLGLVPAGADYVNLTGVSCGAPTLKANPGSGFPVLDVIMTGTGWLQAWRTSSGMGGAAVDAAWIDNLGILWSLGGFRSHSGTAVAPPYTLTNGQRAGLYFPKNNAPALTASGGAMTAVLDADSGFVVGGLVVASGFSGNACKLTTSSAIITASKAIAVADMGITQVCSTATNITLTLSAGVNSGGPGRVLPIFRAGAGTVTVTSGGAVTILGTQFTVNSLSSLSLEWIANDVWLVR